MQALCVYGRCYPRVRFRLNEIPEIACLYPPSLSSPQALRAVLPPLTGAQNKLLQESRFPTRSACDRWPIFGRGSSADLVGGRRMGCGHFSAFSRHLEATRNARQGGAGGRIMHISPNVHCRQSEQCV